MAPRSLSLPFDNNMSTPPHLRPHLWLVLAVVLRALARRLEANAQPPAGTGSQLDIGLAIRQLRDAALSPTTRKAYAGALRRYDDWLAGRAPSDRLLAKYLDVLFHNGLAPASAALTVAAVRRAVRDLARARHDCAAHPVGPVALERLARFRREASERGRGPAPPLLWEDADRMSECAETRGDARGIRDAALIGVASHALLRVFRGFQTAGCGRVLPAGRLGAPDDWPEQDGPARARSRAPCLPGRRQAPVALDRHRRHRVRPPVPPRCRARRRGSPSRTRFRSRRHQAAGRAGGNRGPRVRTFAPSRRGPVPGRARSVAG